MNPVLQKDLLVLLRTRRLAAIQIAFVVTLALFVMLTWPQQGVVTLSTLGEDNMLLGLVLGQLVLLILFVPGLTAVVLTGERESNTLEMLYASRLTVWQIISGKVISALSGPILLLVSGLALVAMLQFRGAIDPAQLGAAYLVLVLTTVLLTVASLSISALCRYSSTALVLAYAVILGICGVSLVPAAIMLESESGPAAAVLHYLRAISPIAAVLSLLRPNPGDLDGQTHGLETLWPIFIGLASLLIITSLFVIALRLARPPLALESAANPSPGRRSLTRRLFFLIDPTRTRKPMTAWNPLLSKEARTNALRSGRWMIRIFYGSICLSMLLGLMSLYGGAEHPDLLNELVRIMVVLQVGLIALVTPSLTSPAISSEIEVGTFETLRLTPLGSGTIFWGKLLPALVPAILPIAALVPAYATLCYIDSGYVPFLLRLAPVALLSILFCCMLGLACSAFCPSTSRATMAGYLVSAILFAGPLAAWWSAGTLLNPRLASWLAMISPLVMSINLMDRQNPSELISGLWPVHLWLMGSLCVLMLAVSRARLSWLLTRG